MGKVLEFRNMVPPALPAAAREPAPEHMRDVVTGTVPADAARYTDPMRRLTLRVCASCLHEWQQPSAIGNCPRCHSACVNTIHVQTIYAPRV